MKSSVSEQLKLLEEVDLRDISVAELVPIIKRLTRNFPVITIANAPKRVFRARKKNLAKTPPELIANIEAPYKHVRQLWYPPADKVTKPSRLNNAHEVLFYCSSSLETAILETRPRVGDVISVIEAGLRQGTVPALRAWGLIEYAANQHPLSDMASAREEFIKIHANERDYLAINAFLEKQLRRSVRPGREYEYKMSIAIGNWLLGRMTDSLHPNTEVDLRKCDGLIYVSVAWSSGYNIALKPDAADGLYEPINCQMYVINRKLGPNEFQGKAVNESQSITEDGCILWRY